VALIPETLERTTLRERLEGSRVNIEPDVMARMIAAEVRRQLERRG
jgi:riboflavin synthase alpha subunit